MAEPKFEKDLDKLEKIVESLEGGGLALDDSLKKFEEGIKLSRRCEQALSAAEKKIEVLTKNAQGQVEAKPFGDAAEAGTAAVEDDEEGDEDDEADGAGGEGGADGSGDAGGDGGDGGDGGAGDAGGADGADGDGGEGDDGMLF